MVSLTTARDNILNLMVDGRPNSITPSKTRQLLLDAIDAVSALLLPLSVFAKTTNPTVNDDGVNSSGNGNFSEGSKWYNTATGEAYICLSAATGAAVWQLITLDTADLGSAALYDVGTGADNVVQLDGSARLPAVDGSQLTNMPAYGDLVAADNLSELTDASAARTNLGLGDLAVQDTIGAADIDAGAVDTAALANGSITADKLDAGISFEDAAAKQIIIRLNELEGGLSELPDAVFDSFDDETGIDTASSLNEVFTTGKYGATNQETDQIPAMTSNSDNGVTLSSTYQNANAYKMFDDDTASFHSTSANVINNIEIDAGSDISVAKYTVRCDVNHSPPTDWEFQKSDDGVSWTTVDTVVADRTWSTGQQKTYDLGATHTARYWKFANIDNTFNTGNWIQTREIELLGPLIYDNLDLISESFTADAQPDTARVAIIADAIDSITLNTDLIASASRDGGTTWTAGTLIQSTTFADGKAVYVADGIDISGQPAGTAMRYRIQTANGKNVKILASEISWG